MSNQNVLFTAIEKSFVDKLGQVTDQELEKAKADVFDPLPYPAFKLNEEDKYELKKLLPNLKLSLVDNSELKCKAGACPKCGRQLNILDVTAKAVKTSARSAAFLEQVFNGTKGKMAISSSFVSDEVKSKLPANIMYVDETAPIPCINCGTEQDVVLIHKFVMHHWRL